MDVFFYGLFMDQNILLKNGIHPANPRKGYLSNYTLKIGNRASLIPCNGEKAYGIVMTCSEESIHKLYAEASVADYIPEKVEIFTDGNKPVEATCYNLPFESLSGTNASYAKSLYQLAMLLDFPADYLGKIKKMAGNSV